MHEEKGVRVSQSREIGVSNYRKEQAFGQEHQHSVLYQYAARPENEVIGRQTVHVISGVYLFHALA
jgi:hypothetical protein